MSDDPLPHVHDTGDGPPLVLLHAFPLDASMWDAQVAVLSGSYRCLRPDAFGCGSSPPPPPRLTLDRVAAAVLRALDERGVGEFALAGLSMGGYTAMAMLRLAPERVRALVLADTRPGADTEEVREERLRQARQVREEGVEVLAGIMPARLLSAAHGEEAHVVDPLRARIRRASPEGLAACLEAMASRPDSGDVLRAVRVPTLVVGGVEDAGSPPEVLRGMAALIPGARLELIEAAGHASNLDQPGPFTRVVAGFLAEAYPAA